MRNGLVAFAQRNSVGKSALVAVVARFQIIVRHPQPIFVDELPNLFLGLVRHYVFQWAAISAKTKHFHFRNTSENDELKCLVGSFVVLQNISLRFVTDLICCRSQSLIFPCQPGGMFGKTSRSMSKFCFSPREMICIGFSLNEPCTSFCAERVSVVYNELHKNCLNSRSGISSKLMADFM